MPAVLFRGEENPSSQQTIQGGVRDANEHGPKSENWQYAGGG
jgi:hypothetical protein